MILKGNERGYGAELARHLLNPRDNDHVTVHALDGFIADNLLGAFAEAEAVSQATQCQKYLFSLSLNPPPEAKVSVEAFENAIAAIERKLGLTGQPRAIVFHEKMGRRHAHVVWSRIDASNMRSINLPHFKRKLMDISRELYRTHEWDMPDGFRDTESRDPNNYAREEAGQAKRAKADPRVLKAMFRRCWEASDSREAFATALWIEGYVLAHGDRRGFVAVDQTGKVWSLSRWCGVKTKELKARLGEFDDLPTIEEAISLLDGMSQRDRPDHTDLTYEYRRSELVNRQRTKRSELSEQQGTRRIAENAARQARLPRGLKSVWAKLSGQYQRLVDELAGESEVCAARDALERQKLIERHLSERRALDQQYQSPDLAEQLNAVFAAAIKPDPRQRLVLPQEDLGFTRKELTKNPELILDHLSYKRARFAELEIKRALAAFIEDSLTLRTAIDLVMKSKQLVRIDDGKDFTTRVYQTAETSLTNLSACMVGAKGPSVATHHINKAMRAQDANMTRRFGGRLSDEQRDALHHILNGKRLSCVVGLAGSGKSTMLETARLAWTAQGIKVRGAALAGKAADELSKSSGIESRTLASLEASWKNGYEPIKAGEILVVDEAGMIGTRQLARITRKIHDIGASLMLIGDPGQLQPIEAGKPFRKIVETHGAARLSQIHRQKAEWQRQASRDLADGNIKRSIAAYENKGCVARMATRDGALASLVEDYLADSELHGADMSRLAFAHRRKDVFALNQAIRAGLRSRGDAVPETLLQTETGPRAIAPGDRIVFTRNDKSIGVNNGVLGTVKEIGDRQVIVELDGDGTRPQQIVFDPRRYRSFDHGYAVTIHKSQGATVERSYVLASRTMDNSQTYVALTRHREGMNIYLSRQDQPLWGKADRRNFSRCRRGAKPAVKYRR